MKTHWLNRSVGKPGPFLALCLDQAEFRAACKHLNLPEIPRWVSKGASGTMHVFESPQGKTVCVVCIDGWQGRDPLEVAGLLIHEASHVWQHHCEDIGERNPGTEQEAYGIQYISQELLTEFARRMKS